MDLRGLWLKDTPAWCVREAKQSSLARVFGGRWFDGEWLFPAYFPFGVFVLQDLETLGLPVTYDVVAAAHRDKLLEVRSRWKELERTGLSGPFEFPADFYPAEYPPFKHQQYGVLQVELWYRRFFLWHMGTGKTRTLLDGFRRLESLGQFRQALILGPPVVLPGWHKELKRLTGGSWKSVHWDGSDEAATAALTAKVVTATYARGRLEATKRVDVGLGPQDVFAPGESRLRQLGYDVIVADESHHIGNYEATTTRAAISLGEVAARRYCLTGTAGVDPRALYGQLRFLAAFLVPEDYQKYCQRYLVYHPIRAQVVVGYENLQEINGAVDLIATRLKKSDAGLNLPPLIEVDLPFVLGPKQRARYNELIGEMGLTVGQGLADPTQTQQLSMRLPHVAVLLTKLLQVLSGFVLLAPDESICDMCEHMPTCVAAHIKPYTKLCQIVKKKPPREILTDFENPKLDVVDELLGRLLAEDPTNKILIWGIFDRELDDLCSLARKHGVEPLRLDSSTTRHIARIEDELRDNPAARILVGNVSAGVGVNLQAANYSIFYSLPWAPAKYNQAIERNNRPGQWRPMTAYRILSNEPNMGLDQFIAELLKFRGRVEYTMLQKITCASCTDKARCSRDGTTPFTKACLYSGTVARPIAKAKVLE